MNATLVIETPAPANAEVEAFTSPCGCPACEKWADCAYCGTCAALDPWAAADAEALEDVRWEQENAGSFAEWMNTREEVAA